MVFGRVRKRVFFPSLRRKAPICSVFKRRRPRKINSPTHFFKPEGYTSHFSDAVRKGYSGTAVYVKEKTIGAPLSVLPLGIAEFDDEGRVSHPGIPPVFSGKTPTFPIARARGARLDYKLRFCLAMKEKLDDPSGGG